MKKIYNAKIMLPKKHEYDNNNNYNHCSEFK